MLAFFAMCGLRLAEKVKSRTSEFFVRIDYNAILGKCATLHRGVTVGVGGIFIKHGIDNNALGMDGFGIDLKDDAREGFIRVFNGANRIGVDQNVCRCGAEKLSVLFVLCYRIFPCGFMFFGHTEQIAGEAHRATDKEVFGEGGIDIRDGIPRAVVTVEENANLTFAS